MHQGAVEGLEVSGEMLKEVVSIKSNASLFAQKFCLGKSPINVENLEKEIQFYNHEDKDCILEGFKTGFRLNYTGPREFVNLCLIEILNLVLSIKILWGKK